MGSELLLCKLVNFHVIQIEELCKSESTSEIAACAGVADQEEAQSLSPTSVSPTPASESQKPAKDVSEPQVNSMVGEVWP